MTKSVRLTKSLPETAGRQLAQPVRLSAGSLAVIILAMLMIYSVVLLSLELSVPAIAGLATTLAGISTEVVRRATQRSRSRRTRGASSDAELAGDVFEQTVRYRRAEANPHREDLS